MNNDTQMELAKKLNTNVMAVVGVEGLIGFEKAYLIANAAGELKKLLTPEYMKPIMALQGNRLGFKTDRDDKGGYTEEQVKNCLIEAVLTGVQPFGNQFNIIAGNCYITKEGFGHLLANFKGLSYELIPSLPRINADKSSAAIVVKLEWTLNGINKTREIDIPVKMNSFMGTDAVIGKATRKGRAWLYNTITGTEIGDGDVQDIDYRTMQPNPVIDKEAERMALMIGAAKTIEDLDKLGEFVSVDQVELFDAKREQLKTPKK